MSTDKPDALHVVAWCSLTRGGHIAYFDGKPILMTGHVGNEHHKTPLCTIESARTALAAQAERHATEIARMKAVVAKVNSRCDHLGIALAEIKAERDALRAQVEAERGKFRAWAAEAVSYVGCETWSPSLKEEGDALLLALGPNVRANRPASGPQE